MAALCVSGCATATPLLPPRPAMRAARAGAPTPAVPLPGRLRRCAPAAAAHCGLSSRQVAAVQPLQPLRRPARRHVAAAALPAAASLAAAPAPLFELAAGLETPVQLAYLAALLALLAGGSYLVVRQVLVRRELETAAKALGERVRDGSATPEELFEMGCVMLRKKVYTQAVRHLESALAAWDGEAEERAQVHNALGFALCAQDKAPAALEQYRAAVALQPGYVTAWNNMGDAHEKLKQYKEALASYTEALSYAPDNAIAQDRAAYLRTRLSRLGGGSA